MLENSTIVIIFPIPGALLTYGKYDYKERTTSGKIITPEQRLFTIVHPVYDNCYKRIILSEKFVNNAISMKSRPKRTDNFKAYTYWKVMSEYDRLQYHIQKYVSDNNSDRYDYIILNK